MEIEHELLHIRDTICRLLVKVSKGSSRIYILNAKVVQPLCLAARCDDDVWRWHEGFGHLNFEALR